MALDLAKAHNIRKSGMNNRVIISQLAAGHFTSNLSFNITKWQMLTHVVSCYYFTF